MKAEADRVEPRGPGLLPRVTDGDTEALRGAPQSGGSPAQRPCSVPAEAPAA